MYDSMITTTVNYRKQIGYDQIILTLTQSSDGSSMDMGTSISMPAISVPDVSSDLILKTIKAELNDFFLKKFETELMYLLHDVYTLKDIEEFATQATKLTLEKAQWLL